MLRYAPQRPVALIDLVDQARHMGVDLGGQGGGQHPSGVLPDNLIERQRGSAPVLSSATALNI
jgi:hypothetical protein